MACAQCGAAFNPFSFFALCETPRWMDTASLRFRRTPQKTNEGAWARPPVRAKRVKAAGGEAACARSGFAGTRSAPASRRLRRSAPKQAQRCAKQRKRALHGAALVLFPRDAVVADGKHKYVGVLRSPAARVAVVFGCRAHEYVRDNVGKVTRVSGNRVAVDCRTVL